jgi:hypothetical protein
MLISTQVTVDFHPHRLAGTGIAGKTALQLAHRKVDRQPHAHCIMNPRPLELPHCHVVQPQHLPRDDSKRLAVLSQLHLTARLDDELVAQQRFQPLHLQADRRLAAAQHLGCPGITAKVDRRDEGAKQVSRQVGDGHGGFIRSSYDWI